MIAFSKMNNILSTEYYLNVIVETLLLFKSNSTFRKLYLKQEIKSMQKKKKQSLHKKNKPKIVIGELGLRKIPFSIQLNFETHSQIENSNSAPFKHNTLIHVRDNK